MMIAAKVMTAIRTTYNGVGEGVVFGEELDVGVGVAIGWRHVLRHVLICTQLMPYFCFSRTPYIFASRHFTLKGNASF